jgi:hypothetical protein
MTTFASFPMLSQLQQPFADEKITDSSLLTGIVIGSINMLCSVPGLISESKAAGHHAAANIF